MSTQWGLAQEFPPVPPGYYARPDSKKEHITTCDKVDYTLQFKKDKGSERYFFNSYTASLDKNGRTAQHMFYINKGSRMTRKEGWNLLEGARRAQATAEEQGRGIQRVAEAEPRSRKMRRSPF